jgi:dephospho-CoA kinase
LPDQVTDSPQRSPLRVALTGGIAAGKTAVSDRLAALGAAVIDTDLIAREVVEPGQPGLKEIAAIFGEEVLGSDGGLNRQALRQLVFNDDHARRRLESILHPRIEASARARIKRHQQAPYIVLVVPLLVETGLFSDVDQVVVVDVPESTQIQRLIERDGIDEQQARKILASQASRQQRLDLADHVLTNNGSLTQLREQVDRLHQTLIAQSQATR